MDHALRQELRQAERDNNYQRLYTLLQRAGRPLEAHKLFLDHPIQVDCTIQYRYCIYWFTSNYNDFTSQERHEVSSCDLNSLIEKFVKEQVGAAQINNIERNAVVSLLGDEIELGTFTRCQSLPAIILDASEKKAIKDKITAHPDYLRNATAEQLAEAREADERDAEQDRRRIETELRSGEAARRRAQLQADFLHDSQDLYNEVWDLWSQHRDLPRLEFAKEVQDHSLRCVLFRLYDIHSQKIEVPYDTQAGEFVTVGTMNMVWSQMEPKRFSIYSKAYRRSHV